MIAERIHDTEDDVLVARKAINYMQKLIDQERLTGGGKIARINRNDWGTLHANASALHSDLTDLLDQLETEFGFERPK